MASTSKKQYGLILKKENASLSSSLKVAAAFADDDDDAVDTQVMSSENPSASTMRIRMQAKRIYERAVAEDPSVFQYDEIYEDIQNIREAKQSEQKKADKERKPKYIASILEAHKRRQVEHQLRDERKQEKERQAEGEMFKDKEVFVTGAYRKQMEEAQELRKELAMQDRLDELTAVEKQKFWQAGFHRTMLHDIARDNETIPSTSKEVSIKTETLDNDDICPPDHGEKLKELRKKVSSLEDEQLVSFDNRLVKTEPKEEKVGSHSKRNLKKSIYSDDSEDDIPKEEVKVELKPGLNVLSKTKKLTKAEQLRSRFTPSASESDGEDFEESGKEFKERIYKKLDHEVSEKAHFSERRSRHRNRSKDEAEKKPFSGEISTKEREKSREREKGHMRYERRDHPHSQGSYSKRHEERRSRSRGENSGKRSLKKEDEIPSKRGRRHNDRGPREPGSGQSKLPMTRIKELKKILKQRNGPEEIAGFKKRYLERRASGAIVQPF